MLLITWTTDLFIDPNVQRKSLLTEMFKVWAHQDYKCKLSFVGKYVAKVILMKSDQSLCTYILRKLLYLIIVVFNAFCKKRKRNIPSSCCFPALLKETKMAQVIDFEMFFCCRWNWNRSRCRWNQSVRLFHQPQVKAFLWLASGHHSHGGLGKILPCSNTWICSSCGGSVERSCHTGNI